MTTTTAGSCKCGAIKVEVQGEPSIVALCHCRNCQKTTGSAFSTNWVFSKSAFKIVAGEPKTFEGEGGSGNPAFVKFCGTCSSSMWTETAMMPDIIAVKAGIMDDGAIAKYVPVAETFTCRKPDWFSQVQGATQYKQSFQAQPEQ